MFASGQTPSLPNASSPLQVGYGWHSCCLPASLSPPDQLSPHHHLPSSHSGAAAADDIAGDGRPCPAAATVRRASGRREGHAASPRPRPQPRPQQQPLPAAAGGGALPGPAGAAGGHGLQRPAAESNRYTGLPPLPPLQSPHHLSCSHPFPPPPPLHFTALIETGGDINAAVNRLIQ